MSRRVRLVLVVAAVLVGGYFAVTAGVRAHVSGLIEGVVGRPLPELAAVDRAGRTWTNADLRGKRVVLHFFRSRCRACELEAAEYRALEAGLPADVVLLHVMTDALVGFPPELAEPTIAAKGFARPVVMADAAFAEAFHDERWAHVTPVTYVADANGVVRAGLRGAQTRAAVEQALAASR